MCSNEDADNGACLLHFLNTSNGRIPLRFQGNAPDLPTGSRVQITGNLADGAVTTATTVTTIAVAASGTLGTHDPLAS